MLLAAVAPFVLAILLLPVAPARADEETPPVPAPGSTDAPEPDPAGTDAPQPEPDPTPAPESTEPGPGDVPPTPDPATTGGDETDPGSTPATEPADGADPTPEPGDAEVPEATDPAAPVPATDPAGQPTSAPTSGVEAQQLGVRRRARVTICHRTNSNTNPYNQIAVSEASAIAGHASHTGPIFTPGADNWGDIIPPIRPGLPDGLNWPEGRPILDNGCETAPPDVGPQPSASIGEVACVGTTPSVEVTVTNGPEATAPARFTILVDGALVETVGPVAPGDSETVLLGGPGLATRENLTFTVEVRSGGEVIDSRVITVDCAPGPPQVGIDAQLTCAGDVAQGTATVTNNGAEPVAVSATVDGTPVGTPVTVGPGTTGTGTIDLSAYEDETVTVNVLVDGSVVATYTVTPDCVAPQADPRVSVAGQVCPPPSATVTLSNQGDPDSQVVFVIRVNGKVVQETAPLFGGDTTTIVGDLSRYEDQTVVVGIRANGVLLDSRVIRVNCEERAAGPAAGAGPGDSVAAGAVGTGPVVLPSVGADVSPGVLVAGLGLVLAGSLLVLAGGARSVSRARE
jgi:hypothetical protein